MALHGTVPPFLDPGIPIDNMKYVITPHRATDHIRPDLLPRHLEDQLQRQEPLTALLASADGGIETHLVPEIWRFLLVKQPWGIMKHGERTETCFLVDITSFITIVYYSHITYWISMELQLVGIQ
jgi:hypothetical protein